MTDRPIIFSAAMVRALLDGWKTQTRRLATSPLRACVPGDRLWVRESCLAEELSRPPSSRPATRTERARLGRTSVIVCDDLDGADGVRYLADETWAPIENKPEAGEAWSGLFHYGLKEGARPRGQRGKRVPSIHMPRWASRLTLIVEEVRIQRLGAILANDCQAEGAQLTEGVGSYAQAFRAIWSALHTAEGQRWEDNPEIVALTFRVERGNIDRIAA